MVEPSSRPHRCRVCAGETLAEPAIAYRQMPRSAQHFPDAGALADDHGIDLCLYQCARCGLLQIVSAPVPYYREVIRAAAFSPDMREFRLAQFAELVERYGLKGQRFLEIGCGKGEYLELLGSTGVRPVGLEYAGAAVRHCRHQGLDVHKGFIGRATQDVPGGPYDSFMSLNFMEHWPRPLATLRGLHRNLKSGAIGLIEVPNLDMILKEKLYSEFIQDHLSYFTTETFTFALQLAGFEVLESRSIWHDYILSAVVRKRLPIDLSALKTQQDRIGRDIRAFVERFPGRSVAVWGAGHQALAALALGGLGNAIRYVIDSAPFKQGKFTPATHIPIVPPTQLAVDPVQAIIVMAAGYSDEVANLIREKHQLAIPVAILRADGLETA
jgi:SAM-dependent methyltransferase